MRKASVACVLLLLAASCSSTTEGGQERPEPSQIQDGITFTSGWWSEALHGPDAVEAMTNLADTGAGWVAIVINWFQGRIAATDIRPLKNMTPPDEDVVRMIRLAHDLGLGFVLGALLGGLVGFLVGLALGPGPAVGVDDVHRLLR